MADPLASKEKVCADCGGWDIEWMYQCRVHLHVEYCRGCECPVCAEGDDDDDYYDGGCDWCKAPHAECTCDGGVSDE